MLLVTTEELDERRRVVGDSPTLQALTERLRKLLEPVLARPTELPTEKPMLSRDGGVCPTDGSRLMFDPLSPRTHRCPRCGNQYESERHYRAWIWRYHLWLSERAIHLALLGSLTGEAALVAKTREMLDAYADLYPNVPNRGNVLGPTRLFFSTYLESIWLVQILIAASLVEGVERAESRARLEPVVRESASLIASFNEGWSNRQVWNNAALIAAGRWLDDDDLFVRGINGPHGIRAQLREAVTNDGLWFEGENYHFFALRGFVLAAELARSAGENLYEDPAHGGALSGMFLAPLDTVLPDLTIPARSDAPFGVSLLQARFAELWEIGWARTADPRLASILACLYGADAPLDDDHGLEDIAEQEINHPGARLFRERLGWKALLLMRPDVPDAATAEWQAGSTLLEDAGVAVLRPVETKYVSVECGGAAGGHGHPDLLHISLYWDRAFLADYGTGSYVTPSLQWYRSTLAHNAPGRAGMGQLARQGWCGAFDARDGWAWCRALAADVFGDGTRATRTVIVGPHYVVDEVEVEAPNDLYIDLPVHPVGGVRIPREAGGAGESEGAEGYETLSSVREVQPPRHVVCGKGGREFDLILVPRLGERVYVATAPGPPDAQFADGAPTDFVIRRASGAGRWVQVFVLDAGTVTEVADDGAVVAVTHADGTVDKLDWDANHLRVTSSMGTDVRLGGAVRAPSTRPSRQRPPRRTVVCPRLPEMPSVEDWVSAVPAAALFELGGQHYRRTEEPYRPGESISARVAVFAAGSSVCFAADVAKRSLCIRRADDPDPGLDNEPPDINSDGLQCYVELDGWTGYLVVPDAASDAVRVHAVAGTAGDPRRVIGSWREHRRGYTIVVSVDTGREIRVGDAFAVNLVINELTPQRQRRTGQLVLSGAAGWAYLRGDREHPAHAVIAEVT